MESTMRDEQQAPYTVTDREDRYDSPEPYTTTLSGVIRRGRPAPYPTDEPELRSLADLRRDLVEARAYLRHAERVMPAIKAEAEYRIISDQYDGDAKQLGANEADRARNLLVRLTEDAEYQAAVATLATAQSMAETAACELEIALDERRAREWASRDRLTTAMMMDEGGPLAIAEEVAEAEA